MISPQRLIDIYADMLHAYNSLGAAIRHDLELLKYKYKRNEISEVQLRKVMKWMKTEYGRDMVHKHKIKIRINVEKQGELYGKKKSRKDAALPRETYDTANMVVVKGTLVRHQDARWPLCRVWNKAEPCKGQDGQAGGTSL